MASIAACEIADAEGMNPGAMEEFHGLPHRVEFVAEIGGVSYYNDSRGQTSGPHERPRRTPKRKH